MDESRFIIEQVTDPTGTARWRSQDERAKRNSAWLEAHWDDLLPPARGKFVAVAEQEGFVAETPTEA